MYDTIETYLTQHPQIEIVGGKIGAGGRNCGDQSIIDFDFYVGAKIPSYDITELNILLSSLVPPNLKEDKIYPFGHPTTVAPTVFNFGVIGFQRVIAELVIPKKIETEEDGRTLTITLQSQIMYPSSLPNNTFPVLHSEPMTIDQTIDEIDKGKEAIFFIRPKYTAGIRIRLFPSLEYGKNAFDRKAHLYYYFPEGDIPVELKAEQSLVERIRSLFRRD